jgi:L-ribulose-5-phosphate 3-epimerase
MLAAFSPAALRAADNKRVPSALAGAPAASRSPRAHKKGFMFSTLRGPSAQKLSVLQRFELMRDAGFDGVEVPSAMNREEVLAARDAAGLEIPSVVISTHWTHPLTSPNPSMRETGLRGLEHGLRDAKAYGAGSVLLVPGVVNKEISYTDAYTRSRAEIKKALPLAESLEVAIAIENVGNDFLLSPLEAARYVDEFQSRFVRWHFDIGNIIKLGWPEHWIEALGPRLVQIHVKEYSRKLRIEKGARAGAQVELFEGDCDWPRIMAALDSVNYSGWLIAEQYRPPGRTDAEWLAKLSQDMDRILVA